jgi:dTDP-4-amino-4,6-dideoxygalactose transaminase
MREAGIESGLHYPVPCHRQPCLACKFVDSRALPESDRWASECLSLPLFFGMTDEQAHYVVRNVRSFFNC